MFWEPIINFWFKECAPKSWFGKDAAFDNAIRKRFLETYWRVVYGDTKQWQGYPEGRLAEILVLDQFARNMFRGDRRAYAADPLALAMAEEAVRVGDDGKLPPIRRQFIYMPYLHSESPEIHKRGLPLIKKFGTPEELAYEINHKKIIDRFGRYPSRNAALGRASTPEEEEYLKEHHDF